MNRARVAADIAGAAWMLAGWRPSDGKGMSGLLGRFAERTKAHIDAVRANAAALEGEFPGLSERAKMHDATKFEDPELVPYVWLTESYRCKAEGLPFEYPEGIEGKTREATLHHVRTNSHHPEFHDPNGAAVEPGSHRDAPDGTQVDGTRMPDMDIAEMVCDWAAVSQERGTSLKGWMDMNVGKRWMFSDRQVALIRRLVDFFEARSSQIVVASD